MRRLALPVVLLLLTWCGPLGAVTFDLHIFPYCPAGTSCGHASDADYQAYICQAVEEMNVIWEPAGFSFRPKIFPIDSTSPTDAAGLPEGSTRYADGRGCADDDADNDVLREHWRDNVAKANRSVISLMLTPGPNRCCSGIPRTTKDLEEEFGIFCDANPMRDAKRQGAVWAHEMGHHWSLAHTHSGCPDVAQLEPLIDADAVVPKVCGGLLTDASIRCNVDADCITGPCVPDALPPVLDTPADPCDFESCDRVCSDDASVSCTTDDDCADGSCGCTDSGIDEDFNDELLNNHRWVASLSSQTQIESDATGISAGSPHAQWCPTEFKDRIGGETIGSDVDPPIEVSVRDVMSYYSDECVGPYVRDGKRYEAFTADQLGRIAACRDVISVRDAAHLPEVCGDRGGDQDHDGLCSDEDNCTTVRNTCQTDGDGDGIGDACDPCPADATGAADIDGDGIGDACDPDRDGDGCLNNADDHPDEGEIANGEKLFVNCSGKSETIFVYEGADVDGDGVPSCADEDDDGDGVCDAAGPGCGVVGDPCPETPGTLCDTFTSSEACEPPWLACLGSGCVEFFLKIVALVDPDPSREVVLDRLWISNRTLFARPTARTAAENVLAIADIAGGLAFLGSGAPRLSAAAAGPVVLEVWRSVPGGGEEFVAAVGQYDLGGLHTGHVELGGVVRLLPSESPTGVPELAIETTFAVGSRAPEAADHDRDGQPDLLDNCIDVPDARLVDADGDGFGDVCDADLDGDGIVTPDDEARVRACAGADLRLGIPLAEPAAFDGEALGPRRRQPDPLPLALAAACRAADLTGDGLVDAADTARVADLLGAAPGPSAVTRGAAPAPRPPVSCVGPAAIDKARVRVTGLGRTSGSGALALAGVLVLPFPLVPELDPATSGVGITLRDAKGRALLEATVPGGDGWKSRRTPRGARYSNDTRVGGLRHVVLASKNRKPGVIKVRVRGEGIAPGLTDAELPVLWRINLDPPAAVTRQCADTAFRRGADGPSCRLRKRGAVLRCR